MAKTKLQKEQDITGLADQLKNTKSAVFANFQGLTVSEMEELRSKCREIGVSCKATKKTLLKRALADAGLEVDTKAYEGGIATFFGEADEVAAAQVVANFAKDHDVVTIFGGTLEGAYIDAEKVTQLSKLLSKQQLLAKFVGTINAPVSGFVNVLAGNLRGLVTVLGAIKEQKS